jgi:hypothetical protein
MLNLAKINMGALQYQSHLIIKLPLSRKTGQKPVFLFLPNIYNRIELCSYFQ